MKKQTLGREEFLFLAKKAIGIHLLADKRKAFYVKLESASLLNELEYTNAIQRVTFNYDGVGEIFIDELEIL